MDDETVQDWETPPEADEADNKDKSKTATEVLEDADAPDADAEKAEKAKKDKEAAAAKAGEKDGDKDPVLDIEAEKKQLAIERSRINKEAFEVRQLKKKLKDKEAAEKPVEIELTDAQFEQLVEAHREDPKMMVQIMKQMSKQQAKGLAIKPDDAVNAVEVKQLKTEMDNYLTANFPDLSKEDSELRGNLDKAKSLLRVEDSPFGDFLGMAGIMLRKLPEIVKAAEERGRASALKEKAEDTRKKTIHGNKPPAGGEPPDKKDPSESNNYGLTADQMETAKKNFGFTKPQQFKWYAANLKTAKTARAA